MGEGKLWVLVTEGGTAKGREFVKMYITLATHSKPLNHTPTDVHSVQGKV